MTTKLKNNPVWVPLKLWNTLYYRMVGEVSGPAGARSLWWGVITMYPKTSATRIKPPAISSLAHTMAKRRKLFIEILWAFLSSYLLPIYNVSSLAPKLCKAIATFCLCYSSSCSEKPTIHIALVAIVIDLQFNLRGNSSCFWFPRISLLSSDCLTFDVSISGICNSTRSTVSATSSFNGLAIRNTVKHSRKCFLQWRGDVKFLQYGRHLLFPKGNGHIANLEFYAVDTIKFSKVSIAVSVKSANGIRP